MFHMVLQDSLLLGQIQPLMDALTWNERYTQPGYLYGTNPNFYFEQVIRKLKPGQLLLPAEGEGRNAVFAATLGWDVSAFDQSEAARAKALSLAAGRNVKIDYRVGDVLEMDYSGKSFNCIALIYLHLPAKLRRQAFRRFTGLLDAGGCLIMEAFSKKHLGNTRSGPKTIELLYDSDDIRKDFDSLEFVELYETYCELDEGPLHQGPAEVIRLMARKPL